MRLLDVYTPAVDAFVRYKVMDPRDVDIFVQAHKEEDRDTYTKLVLESVVYNFRSEIADILRQVNKKFARKVIDHLYTGCVMLNPGLDIDYWMEVATSKFELGVDLPTPMEDVPVAVDMHPAVQQREQAKKKKRKTKPITRAKFLGLQNHLKERVVGQDEAIEALIGSLKRTVTGLGDADRPLGVFLFSGSSGVGKTLLAKELHNYLFGDTHNIVRIDCGEYQHKHENQKLIGSPNGYVGYEDGGQLTNKMRENSRTVVLLDEIEKAHTDIWDTFLRVFDEGILTDNKGREISFRESIIIMTTNLGNREIVDSMMDTGTGFSGVLVKDLKDAKLPARYMVEKRTKEAIFKKFRPELLNRIDKTIVFNHLQGDVFDRIAELELARLIEKLSKRGISLTYDDSVIQQMVKEGVNNVEGARGLAQVRRETIEDVVSDTLIKSTRWSKGTIFTLNYIDGNYKVTVKKPAKKKKAS